MRITRSIVLALITTAAVALGGPAAAATIVVDTTSDGYGNGPGCTLREAIHAANDDTFFDYCSSGALGRDVIVLGPGVYRLTIAGSDNTGAAGDLDVTDHLVIRGAGMAKTVIDATGLGDRVLHAIGSANLTLEDLTIRKGDAGMEGGGGIQASGTGTLTLRRAAVRDSEAAAGGGIYVLAGTLLLREAVVARNDADGTNNGAGIYHVSSGPLTIDDSAIIGNTGADLGGCGSPGGGIVSYSDVATITASLIAGNSTDCQGGTGIFNSGTMTVSDSTISGNTGVGAWMVRSDDTLTLVRTTIAEGGEPNVTGVENYGTLTSMGSLFQTPLDTCNSVGTYVSGGGNLFADEGCGPGGGDVFLADAKLRPLADNGGPTLTHALPKASPARDLVPSAKCGATDQRGAPRKGSCDAGAYEYTTCRGVVVNRVGTPKKDVLVGTAKRDGFLALGGNDTVRGRSGNDALCLGPGKDRGFGGPGKDRIFGEGGNDVLKGQGGNDLLDGGPGPRDRCVQGPGTGPIRRCELP